MRTRNKKSRSPIKIDPGVLALLTQMQTQSQAYRVTVAGLEMGMTRIVEKEYGIDLTKDDWLLDLPNGTLVQQQKENDGPPQPTE